jgi:hypothetical protein
MLANSGTYNVGLLNTVVEQQDGAPAYYAIDVLDFLNSQFLP